MATIKVNPANAYQYGNTAHGNVSSFKFGFETNTSGIPIDTNATAAVAIDDKIILGSLPAGMVLENATLFIEDATNANVTATLGFEYKDGENDSAVPQSATHFLGATSLATTGRVNATGNKLVTLPKPAFLVLTVAGAAINQKTIVKAVVMGELTGNP